MNGDWASEKAAASLAALFWDASIRRVFAAMSVSAAVSFYGDFIPSDGSSFFAPRLQFTSEGRESWAILAKGPCTNDVSTERGSRNIRGGVTLIWY